MKKLMGLTLGLTLLTWTATVAFSQTDTDKKKATKKKPASQQLKDKSQQVKGEAKKTTNTDRKAQ